METSFAPAERTDRNVFNRQIENISTSPVMSKLLEASCGLLVVLNEERQIVGLNEAFLNSLGMKNLDRVLGLRLGETLECIHATERPHGCGTTPHCGSCGAAIATMSAIIDDVSSEQTCALTAEKDGKTVDLFLSVTARPFMVDGSRWILLFAQDITQQHSHASLEKIFYHDFNNILMVLTGCGDLLSMKQPDNALATMIQNTSRRLCAEVELQRFLSNHQGDGTLLPQCRAVTLGAIQEEIELIILNHPSAERKNVEQICHDKTIELKTDIYLLSRVIGNMLLNALESTDVGGTVRLVTSSDGKEITWEVWNDTYIAPDIQRRIFQKHFSTKNTMGRGLGTYSMRLLGEKYLPGKVSFTTSPEEGTTFRFQHPATPP